MARFSCPNCSRKLKIAEYVVSAVVRCPGCSQVFQVKFAAKSPAAQAPPGRPAANPGAVLPLLTQPHSCQQCGETIASAVGRAAATVLCSSCNNKTSIYAILHRCPACSHLLESPARSAGTETACPACTDLLRVPRDVLRKEPPAGADEFWFGCYCPACSGELATREKDVGTYAVCPHCLVPLTVPYAGHYLPGSGPPPAHDPLDSLNASKAVPCPKCGTRFPVRAAACPACGAGTPSASPW